MDQKNQYSEIKKRTLLTLQKIQGNKAAIHQIKLIDKDLIKRYQPNIYHGSDGLEVRMIKDFEESIILLSQHVNRDPKKMTVLEYYQSLETVKKQVKNKEKLFKKRK